MSKDNKNTAISLTSLIVTLKAFSITSYLVDLMSMVLVRVDEKISDLISIIQFIMFSGILGVMNVVIFDGYCIGLSVRKAFSRNVSNFMWLNEWGRLNRII